MIFRLFINLTLILPISAFSQNYKLEISEIFQSCDFVHTDTYSLQSLSKSIRFMLELKLEGSQECNSSFNQLHTDLNRIEALTNQTVSPTTAQEVFDETYTSYIVTLTQEASILNVSDPDQKLRYNTIMAQLDSLKSQLYDNKFNLEFNKEMYSSEISALFKKDLFNYSRSLFSTLNNVPNECVNNIGGWKQVIPTILKVSSLVGSTMGPTGAIVGAGLEAASQLAILLQNKNLKKTINNINQRQNEKILACAYLSMQTTACDLQRAKSFSENKDKIKKIIFRDFSQSKYKEYERFYTALRTLPFINEILQSVGEMGSAVTLDVELITKYFNSVKIRPSTIKFPDEDGKIPRDEVLQKFLLEMKNRGIDFSDFNHLAGKPLPLLKQLDAVKDAVQLAQATIGSVILILKEKRSFVDLLGELTVKNQNIKKKLEQLQTFLSDYPKTANFPEQYKGLFKSADRMLEALINFIGVIIGNKDYDTHLEEVDKLGGELFTIMSQGSVAQITSQTALMVPAIAFERFSRPFKALENFYLNRDIERKGDPNYIPFLDYMMNESLQVKVIRDYKVLSSSKAVGRLEDYEVLRRSFQKGFKKEIKRMIKSALKSKSDVLTSFKGKTGSHLCALFTPFLIDEDKKLLDQCKRKYKKLELLSILEDFNRKISMNINYESPCFYSDYKREESAQRILFDKLLDYGINP